MASGVAGTLEGPDSLATRRLGRIRGTHLAGALVIAQLLAAGAYLAVQADRLWFFSDDWNFLLVRGLSHDTWRNLFAPHNEHWSTIPVLVFRTLYSIFGVRHYLPYALVVIVAHIGICAMVWLLLRRVGIGPWVAAGATGVLAFLGAGAEDTLWDFQMGFVGAVFFGVLALVLIERIDARWWREAAAWAALLGALMSSGIGLPMTVCAVVFALLLRGWQSALLTASVPLIVYAIWYVAIGHTGTVSDRAGVRPGLIPRYMWHGITGLLERVSGLSAAGTVLFVVIVLCYAYAVARFHEPAARLAIAGGFGIAALYLSTAITRARFGISQSTASRYMYIAAVLLLPLLAWVAQVLIRRVTVWTAVPLVAAAALLVVNGAGQTGDFADARHAALAGREARMLAAVQLANSGERLLSQVPDPRYAPDVRVELLRRPGVRRAFPHPPINSQGMLDARAYLQVGVSPQPFRDLPVLETLWGRAPREEGCVARLLSTARPYLDVAIPPTGGQVVLRQARGRISTVLLDGNEHSVGAPWVITRDEMYLGSTAGGMTMRINFAARGASLYACG